MKVGDKVNFVFKGKTYTGLFLEEQCDLFDKKNVSWTLDIRNKESRTQLNLSKKETLSIKKEQSYTNERKKKQLLLKYPSDERTSLEKIEQDEAFMNLVGQLDMFEEPLKKNKVLGYK